MLEIIFAYGAGLLTLINPCVLPVLPIVLASAAQGNKAGPIALAAGMGVTFVILGMLVATVGYSIGLTENLVAQIGASLMMAFGVMLLVPAFSRKFELATAGFAGNADQRMSDIQPNGLFGQFVGGALLGAIWSPCIGPTLGAAISLASQGQNLIWVTAILTSFAFGVGTIILALAYGTREALKNRQTSLRIFAQKSKPILGTVFIGVGLMIFFKIHHKLEGFLVELMPYWLLDLSVAL